MMAPRTISVGAIIVFAAAEVLIALRHLAEHLPEQSTIIWTFATCFAVNYFLAILYSGIIYPYFLDPLRVFPSAKVRD